MFWLMVFGFNIRLRDVLMETWGVRKQGQDYKFLFGWGVWSGICECSFRLYFADVLFYSIPILLIQVRG